MNPHPFTLTPFVEESNRIEGIFETTKAHVDAHVHFLRKPPTIDSLVELVGVLQPDARLRDDIRVPGVRVGNHIAPPSGEQIAKDLEQILKIECPWEQHVAYETLHPFTDGNGRSGRALWANNYGDWSIGFLHRFYYQTLENRERLTTPNSSCRKEK